MDHTSLINVLVISIYLLLGVCCFYFLRYIDVVDNNLTAFAVITVMWPIMLLVIGGLSIFYLVIFSNIFGIKYGNRWQIKDSVKNTDGIVVNKSEVV